MKRTHLVLLFVICLVLTGCYPVSNIEKNLVPPIGNFELESLTKAIREKYPEFVYYSMQDQGNSVMMPINPEDPLDPLNYALIQEAENGPIHLLVVDKTMPIQLIHDIYSPSKDIQQLKWWDIRGGVAKELMISFFAEDLMANVFEIYTFENGVAEIYSNTCNNWIYGDLDSAGNYLYIVKGTKTSEGFNRFTLEQVEPAENFRKTDSLRLDLFYGVEDIQIGNMNPTQKALFLDGVSGAHSGVTELVRVLDGDLTALLQSPNGINEATLRPYYSPSKDVDHDGVIEVPFMQPAKGDEELAMYETNWITQWKSLSENGSWLTKAYTTDAYGIGTIEVDPVWLPYLGVDSVYEYNGASSITLLYHDNTLREPLLSYYMVPKEYYDEKQYPDGVMIQESPLYVLFYVRHSGGETNMIQWTDEEIRSAITPETWLNQ